MKFLLLLLLPLLPLTSEPVWLLDMEEAKAVAAREQRGILISFSGSDWCIPCIRMHKEVYGAPAFARYAADSLVLVRADFPRKKNALPKEQVARNEALAARYNPEGRFPFTVLTDASGRVLATWDGDPGLSPDAFVSALNRSRHASR
jgi:thioredoxin-related protein